MNIEETKFIFEGFQLIISILIVYLAWKALNTWKKEVIGKDKYHYSKKMIDKVKDLRFIINSNHSEDPMSIFMSQVHVADLVLERESLDFHKNGIEDKLVLFDYTYLNACDNFDLRKDLDMPSEVRELFNKVLFRNGDRPNKEEDQNPVLSCPDYREGRWTTEVEEWKETRFKPINSQEIKYGEFLETWKMILEYFMKETK